MPGNLWSSSGSSFERCLILRFLGRGYKKNLTLQDPSFSSEDFLTQKARIMLYEDTAT